VATRPDCGRSSMERTRRPRICCGIRWRARRARDRLDVLTVAVESKEITMSEDISTPVPDEPGQDPDAPLDEPTTDRLGLSDSPHSGYEEEMSEDGTRPQVD